MCNPIAMVAASAVLSLAQQDAQASATNRAADEQQKNINRSTMDNYAQLNRQGVEESQNAAVEGAKLSRDVVSRVSTGRAQAGSSGVTGLSVNAMLLDLAGKGLDAQTTAETNYACGAAARADQATEIYNNATGQLGSIQRSSGVGVWDVAGAGLKIANAYTAQNVATQKAATAANSQKGTLAEQRAEALARMGKTQ